METSNVNKVQVKASFHYKKTLKERHVFFTKSSKILLIKVYKQNKMLQFLSVQGKLE